MTPPLRPRRRHTARRRRLSALSEDAFRLVDKALVSKLDNKVHFDCEDLADGCRNLASVACASRQLRRIVQEDCWPATREPATTPFLRAVEDGSIHAWSYEELDRFRREHFDWRFATRR